MKFYHYNTMLFDDLRSLISRGLTHDTKTKPPTIIKMSNPIIITVTISFTVIIICILNPPYSYDNQF